MGEINWENFKKMKIPPRLMYINLVLVTICIMVFVAIYWQGMERDRNFAYAAMYYDDAAVDLYRANATEGATIFSAVAWQFCDLYELEHRTVHDINHYKPLCDAIQERTAIYVMCADQDILCPQWRIDELERLLQEAEPIAKDLQENPPYYGYVLGYNQQYVTQSGDPITLFPDAGGQGDASG